MSYSWKQDDIAPVAIVRFAGGLSPIWRLVPFLLLPVKSGFGGREVWKPINNWQIWSSLFMHVEWEVMAEILANDAVDSVYDDRHEVPLGNRRRAQSID